MSKRGPVQHHVFLTEEEDQILRALAERECRTFSEQLIYFVRQGLQRDTFNATLDFCAALAVEMKDKTPDEIAGAIKAQKYKS